MPRSGDATRKRILDDRLAQYHRKDFASVNLSEIAKSLSNTYISGDVRLGSSADSAPQQTASLFDHFVGAARSISGSSTRHRQRIASEE